VIKAFGFDFDHTLGIDNKLERVAFLRMLDLACELGGRCNGTLAQETVEIDAMLARQRSGEFTIEHAVDRFMRERGIGDAEHYAGRYKEMCVEMVRSFVIRQPGARELIDGLRRREVPSAILTNGWSPLQQYKAVHVGFTGPVLVSADIGTQKPSLEAFCALSDALGVPLAEIAYVGDTPGSDIAGALEAGMSAIWFDAGEVEYPAGVPQPTAVIHSLPELLSLA
jgi:FMN phosphatase YigB (HAD superfamily)